jgi:hypothetical protein
VLFPHKFQTQNYSRDALGKPTYLDAAEPVIQNDFHASFPASGTDGNVRIRQENSRQNRQTPFDIRGWSLGMDLRGKLLFREPFHFSSMFNILRHLVPVALSFVVKHTVMANPPSNPSQKV